MKKVIVLIVLFQLTFSFAQNRRGGQQQGNIKIPKFEAAKTAGIFQYDSKKILKKLKLKKKDSLATSVETHLATYNSEIEIIGNANKDLFEGLDVIVNQNMKSAIQNRDRAALMETRKMTIEKIKPVRDEVKKQEEQLNKSLEALLSEEQNKKWLSYQKFQKEKLEPKIGRPNGRGKPNSGARRSRGRRGGFLIPLKMSYSK